MTCEAVAPDDIFECRKCGHCCQGFGGTYVTPRDVDNIAEYTGISEMELRDRYCQPSDGRLVLAQDADGFCVFWDKLCTIHPVKPRMCRAWPFIEGVLRAPENWTHMAEACPGIRTEFPEKAIVACVRQQLDALPEDGHVYPNNLKRI